VVTDARTLDVLALTSRLVKSDVKPLSAREYWRISRISEWASAGSAAKLSSESGVERDLADRVVTLLHRRTALALVVEQLEQSGVWTTVAGELGYPARMLDRLGDSSPPVLHGVGDPELLGLDGLGVVGSRDVTPEGAQVAADVGRRAAEVGVPLISGAARGTDQLAMNAAYDSDGVVVGVTADSLVKSVQKPSVRRGVAAGRICLVTPFSPRSGFSPANAMARNKLIYALSRVCFVVAAADGSGGTWAGAVEALRGRGTPVAVWLGPGAGDGNRALTARGAEGLENLAMLDQWLRQPTQRSSPIAGSTDQLALDV